MALYVRKLTSLERRQLRRWIQSDDRDLQHRSRVILLSSEGYRVPEISPLVDAHPTNLRKWIHRFNDCGTRGLISPRGGGPPPRFSPEQKRRIARLAERPPRDLGLPFSRWTLHKLAAHAEEQGIVDSISHEYVRQILKGAGVDYRQRRRPQNSH